MLSDIYFKIKIIDLTFLRGQLNFMIAGNVPN